jgi:hypothetical protein
MTAKRQVDSDTGHWPGGTVLVAVPLGEAVRNVLRTDAFEVLKRQPDVRVVILSQGAGDPSFRQEFEGPNVVTEMLYPYAPSKMERALQSFRIAMLHGQSSTIRVYARRSYGTWLSILVPIATLAVRLFGKARVNRLLGALSSTSQRVARDRYGPVFDRYRPDLVVLSRVLNHSADSLVLQEASRRRIPTVALAASWDNFTSKGFFPFGIDRVVVWNEIMRGEAIELFDFPPEHVYVSGIARFDTYFSRAGIRPREDFLRDFDLDPAARIITYTTGHAQIGWPYEQKSPEPAIVQLLVDAIEHGVFGDRTQLILRLHPQASPDDFRSLAQHPAVRMQIPGRPSPFQDRDLSRDENRLLAETMLYSNVVVNIASTITIDAAVFDTPVVCVGFDLTGRPPDQTVRRFYDFEHYQKLAACGGFRRADNPEELVAEIVAYLRDRSRDAEGRRRMVEQQCAFTDGRSGDRVGRFLLRSLAELRPRGAALQLMRAAS